MGIGIMDKKKVKVITTTSLPQKFTWESGMMMSPIVVYSLM